MHNPLHPHALMAAALCAFASVPAHARWGIDLTVRNQVAGQQTGKPGKRRGPRSRPTPARRPTLRLRLPPPTPPRDCVPSPACPSLPIARTLIPPPRMPWVRVRA